MPPEPVSVDCSPIQISDGFALACTAIGGGWVTAVVELPLHPMLSVTANVYVPGVSADSEAVFCPPGCQL